MGESAGIGCFHTEKDSTFCDSCQYYYEKVNNRDPPEKLVVNSLDTMISGCIPNSLIGINPGGRSAVCARIVEMIRKV